MWIFAVVVWLFFGLAGAVAGERRGRSGAGFALGFFFGPWGMVAAMMLAPSARVAYEAACDRVALEDHVRRSMPEMDARDRVDRLLPGGQATADPSSARNLLILSAILAVGGVGLFLFLAE